MRHGSINVAPASFGLRPSDQTWHNEQWLYLTFAGRKRRRDVSPADSKSRQKCLLHTNACTTGVGHLLALIAPSSCLRCSLSVLTAQTSCPTSRCGLAQLFFCHPSVTYCSLATDVRRTFSHDCMPPESCLRPEFATSRTPSYRLPVFKGKAVPLLCASHFARRTFSLFRR